MAMSNLKRFLLCGIMAGLTLLAGCATNPVTGENDFVLMSEDQEIALGRKMHPQVLQEMGKYDAPELQAYVQRVGEALAEHSHRPGLIYRFTVLDSPDVNAFALPGGYIYITRGLLAYLNSEAEMAAVLGHEIGHVTARHTVRQQTTATVTGLLGAVIAGSTGVQGAQDIANIAGTAIVRGYGREHELEADRLGAEYLARTGYDPEAMLEVIKVLKNQEEFERQLAKEEGREPRIYHGLFSTHPSNDTRLQEVVHAADASAGNGGRVNHDVFLEHSDGLVFGDSEQEGIRRGNHFYHAPLNLAITFPEGWKVENLSDRVVATTPSGDGVIQFTMADLNRRISPREFFTERLNLSDLQHGESIELLGMPGYTAVAEQNTTKGRLAVRYVVLYRDDKALIFNGAADNTGEPYRYDRLVLETARSFHPLIDAERKLAQALRIHVIRADRSTTFPRLASESNIPNHPEAQLRLINDLYPQGKPEPGQLIKTVR